MALIRRVESLIDGLLKQYALPIRRREMAWRCHGKNNDELVNNLSRHNVLKTERIANVMRKIDRGDFAMCTDTAYDDAPQAIGFAVTISAPHMHAYALEALRDHLPEGGRALDIGSGSGYLTACMAAMVGPRGRAIGVDHIPQLVEMSVKNVKKKNKKMLETGQLQLFVGDGRDGYPGEAPYDAIHVGAAAEELPTKLVDQLKPGGRLVCPVGKEYDDQVLLLVDKKADGSLVKTKLFGVRYVPLTDREKQYPGRIS
ncbi:protein-L-isoaspartate(D-aspartate) O-methyltransferase [Galendromus occidentalis]|uniref:Protein-L-isoaspartate O-methyltransferase n=1 Tax=Galendromus occidentalis TaxID=34638 RepID=A0AAJ6VZC0_9ACAR|nr:protein-L-isoaspartate(D-aspartate) O-methyltransferase [Galendromus occidentalis]